MHLYSFFGLHAMHFFCTILCPQAATVVDTISLESVCLFCTSIFSIFNKIFWCCTRYIGANVLFKNTQIITTSFKKQPDQ